MRTILAIVLAVTGIIVTAGTVAIADVDPVGSAGDVGRTVVEHNPDR